MMQIVPYKPEHLTNLLLQPAQAYMRPFFDDPQYGRALAIPGKAFTAIECDRVLGCAGLIPYWEGRAEAWSLLANDIKGNFVPIHMAALRFLDSCGFRRVEAHVDADFGCAKRWMDMLGFQYEGPLKAYTPDGRDCLRYARVRG
jgi:RimJ/RimL family protein N-acetyltransferase